MKKDLEAKRKANEDHRLPETSIEKLRKTSNRIEVQQASDSSDIIIIKSDVRTLTLMKASSEKLNPTQKRLLLNTSLEDQDHRKRQCLSSEDALERLAGLMDYEYDG